MTIFGFLLIRYFKKKRITEKGKSLKKEWTEKWNATFDNAKERADFEFIHQSRQEWRPLVGFESEKIEEFFRILDNNQYKESWSDSDYNEVVESFEKIKKV